jgi:uncharacterized repeat protein (TIGR03803 family)
MPYSFKLTFHRFRQALLPAALLWLFVIQAHGTPVFETVQGFLRLPRNPSSELIQASDGNFYGTTSAGGTKDYGTVFKMTPSGTLTSLVHFMGNNGRRPQGSLVQSRLW